MDAVRGAYGTWGYPIVFVGALAENTALLGLILPGGTLVLLGAVYAQEGSMSLPGVLLLGWAGMIAGTSLDFAFGRWGLHSTLGHTRLVQRLQPRLVDAQRFLRRHGMWALLLAHFIGHVRSFVAITAGASRLSYRRFLAYEAVAALAWNTVWVGAGYLIGSEIETVQRVMGRAGLVIAAAAVVLYILYRLFLKERVERAFTSDPQP